MGLMGTTSLEAIYKSQLAAKMKAHQELDGMTSHPNRHNLSPEEIAEVKKKKLKIRDEIVMLEQMLRSKNGNAEFEQQSVC